MTLLAALLAGLGCAVAVGLPVRPTSTDVPAAVVAPLVVLGCLVLGLPAAIAGGLVAVAVVQALRQRATTRADAAERAGAVEAVAVLAAELRVGRGPGEALAAGAALAEGPFAAALAAASRAMHVGADPSHVLRHASASAAHDALRGLAACLQVCAGSGGSLARATDTVAEALRAEQDQRLEVESELAGPRATALMLAGLPLAGTLLAAGLGARPLHVLLHTSIGGGCLVLGVLLDLAGLWWTQRLVAGALR
ncbi:MAG: type II secretion system F family protein [Mycobacteriales bacterium]